MQEKSSRYQAARITSKLSLFEVYLVNFTVHIIAVVKTIYIAKSFGEGGGGGIFGVREASVVTSFGAVRPARREGVATWRKEVLI